MKSVRLKLVVPRPFFVIGIAILISCGSEKVETMSASTNPEVVAIAGAMHFSDRDLQENRAGRISEAQRRRLRPRLIRECFQVSLCLLAIVGFLIAPREPRWILAALAFAGISVWLSVSAVRLVRDVLGSEVAALSGRVERLFAGSNRVSVTLAGIDFNWARSDDPHLRVGSDYVIRYLPRSRTVVSVEPVGTP